MTLHLHVDWCSHLHFCVWVSSHLCWLAQYFHPARSLSHFQRLVTVIDSTFALSPVFKEGALHIPLEKETRGVIVLNREANTSLALAAESHSSRNIWAYLTSFECETRGLEQSDSSLSHFPPNQIVFNSFVTNLDSVYRTTNAVKNAHTLKHSRWRSEGSLLQSSSEMQP